MHIGIFTYAYDFARYNPRSCGRRFKELPDLIQYAVSQKFIFCFSAEDLEQCLSNIDVSFSLNVPATEVAFKAFVNFRSKIYLRRRVV